jgi:hypothetical protein
MLGGLGWVAFLRRVFYQGDDSTCHESCCADDSATARHFGDLDQATSDRGLHSTSGLGCRHLVSAGGSSDVDDYLDSITLHRVSCDLVAVREPRVSKPYEDMRLVALDKVSDCPRSDPRRNDPTAD